MPKFSDSNYALLKTYFDVLKTPRSGTDNSYILGQNHTIVADGGVFTTLYQENDENDMIAHNFRIIDIDGNNFKFKYEGIASTHTAATVLEVGKPMFFRKDEKFRDWLVNNIDLYEDYVNTNKLFIYFGMINPVADNTGQVGIHYNIQFEGMKNFVHNALPENNRNTNIDEFISIYYDRVAHPIYNMTKGLWSFFDAKEVNLKHLDHLATRAGISTDTDLISELPLREFVDLLPYWMKRKSSYTSYYIIHKILLANTKNKLNIYEKWAEWCLRDLRGDKAYILPEDFQVHHINQHYGRNVSGGAGPEYYDQWNEYGDDDQEEIVVSPVNSATDVLNDTNDINGWRAKGAELTTSEREGDRWSMRVKFLDDGAPSAHAASEPFSMIQGQSYHFEYDAGAERPEGHQWGISIETPRASAGSYPDERVYSKLSRKGYGRSATEGGLFNSFETSGAYIVPTVTADDYQVKLFSTHHSYFDNVYLVKIPTPETGFPLAYPVYSETPTADCRANTWNFGDEIDMQTATIVFDEDSNISQYDTIVQIDDYSPESDVLLTRDSSGDSWQPDINSPQSPSAAGEYNHYEKVNLDSFSKPSGGLIVWSMSDTQDVMARPSTNNFLAVEYMLRHRDGTLTEAIGDDMMTNSWTNDYQSAGAYDTLESTGGDITSAISDGSAVAMAASNEFTTETGKLYQLVLNLTLNSGTAPRLYVQEGDGSGWITGISDTILTPGETTFEYEETSGGSSGRLAMWIQATATNFSCTYDLYELQAIDGIRAARCFNIHEGYQGNLYSRSTSGRDYYADTEYHLGIHKSTSPAEKIYITEDHVENFGMSFASDEGLSAAFDNVIGNDKGFNTSSASAGAYIYFDMGQGNDQPISMCRMYRRGTTGTVPQFQIEASPDGFSTPSASIALTNASKGRWSPGNLGWNKYAWHNTTPYRFFRIILLNTPGSNDGYDEIEFYKGDMTDKPEFRLNIFNNARMKNPNDLIESVRLQLHEDVNYVTQAIVNKLHREPDSQAPTASLYYDIEDLNYSGGFTRSIGPTGNLILTPHYNVEIDLSSEPMGPIDEIITVGQAEEIIRYWEYLKPVDKFVDHSFLISPVGKIDELHESVSLYDPLKLGICDTRFIGVSTLATTAAPGTSNSLIDNHLMDDTGYWRDWQYLYGSSPVTSERSTEQYYSPSGSWKLVTDGSTGQGFESQNITMESGFEYQINVKIFPVDTDNIRIMIPKADEGDTWQGGEESFTALVDNLILGEWNDIKIRYAQGTSGDWGRISFYSNVAGTWYIDDVLMSKGKLDIFTKTSVEKRTFATPEWSITHDLGDVGVMTQIFDPDENIIYPKRLEIVDGDKVRAHFNAGQRGRAFTAAVKSWGKHSNTHHFQSSPASAWDITHNLGTSGASGVCYQVYNGDLSSNIVPQDVQLIDINNLRVTFPVPVSGYCFIRDDDYYHINPTAESVWRVHHDINARGLICHAYDHNGYRQYPETIVMEDYNTARIDWSEPVSGTASFVFFEREFTSETLLNSMGISGAGADSDKMTGEGGSRHGFWKIGNGSTLGFDPIIGNDLDSICASGNIDDILVTSDDPSGSILFNFHVPRETEHTITEMGLFDLDKNLQYYTKTGELHKPENVQLDVRYRIRKLPTANE